VLTTVTMKNTTLWDVTDDLEEHASFFFRDKYVEVHISSVTSME
jgi:hypothetical protein